MQSYLKHIQKYIFSGQKTDNTPTIILTSQSSHDFPPDLTYSIDTLAQPTNFLYPNFVKVECTSSFIILRSTLSKTLFFFPGLGVYSQHTFSALHWAKFQSTVPLLAHLNLFQSTLFHLHTARTPTSHLFNFPPFSPTFRTLLYYLQNCQPVPHPRHLII